ncbi:DMT family transporter [Nocardioides sp. Kera G14]|uniref:DMT family transporter n=1 Tax=Nocardioides sp. Kera G14 TaxID=2884264 RepID=UPI001D0F75F6|nr:DMT family transporter [Nocardioides sp. Kera G14]UDY22508.1 DMT family transporter [Nocardioides sp. Kera G14]
MKRGALLPTLALLIVTASWGSTFPLTKDLVTRVPVADYLSVRFVVAGVVLCAIAPGAVRRLPRPLLLQSVLLGVVYGLGQIVQTVGLQHTSATVSGFLTGLYVVLTPVLAWLILRQWIGTVTWIAVALAAVGLGVLSLNGFSIGFGEGLTVLSAVLYALHIVGLGRWSEPEHAIGVSAVQLVVIGLLCLACAVPGGVTLPSRGVDWAALIYMAIVAGLIGMLGQTWAQAHLPATRAAIIMSMEPVFAAIFGVGFGGDSVTLRMGIGCVIVLVAMLLAEMGPRQHPEVEQPHLAV